MVDFSDRSLLELGGWQVFREAKSLRDSGRVVEARFDPPVLRGIVMAGGRRIPAGLRFGPGKNVDNLCLCRESQSRGIICAHSIAVALAHARPPSPPPARPGSPPPPHPAAAPGTAPTTTARASAQATDYRALTDELPEIVFEFDGSLRHIEGGISFGYSKPGLKNPAAEGLALARLTEMGFVDEGGRAVLRGEDAILRFHASHLPRLEREWKVAAGSRYAHVTKDLVRITPHFQLAGRDGGWMDFMVHYSVDRQSILTRTDLQRLLAGGDRKIKLKDGRIAVADRLLEEELDEVLHDCNPSQTRTGIRIDARQAAYLSSCIADWEGREGSPAAAPAATVPPLGSLAGRLRPYQAEGARWMLALAARGLGGLLADEMGLGKTVQALALVEALGGTALVVCPSSLVWNWVSEAARFLPGLPVLALDGPKRAARFGAIPSSRLVVTSYALLRRDLEAYAGLEFSTVILDEAQHIKNPGSQNAKAACALRSRSRFVLTGTPVENSLRDLWSVFEFLLPGYLGDRADFKSRYEDPLAAGERGPIRSRLNRRIAPYVLRRRKAALLPELPEKIEQVLAVELEDSQKAVYSQLQRAAREQVDVLGKTSGGAARMRALTALLRLRQACCDLRLLGSPAPGSAKLAALRELLEEAIDGGHRTLVFSQFTSMLDLIAEDLDGAGISYCRLDGSTRDRAGVVATFQNSPAIPVFLISLKAGGTGLNLTAADTVIHFDPWWNPAVEAQATDRAHRIGQERVVTSIKLICRDTVEERVLRLQESKKELFADTLDPEAAFEKLDDNDLRALVEN